jgi:dihydroxyacetone kinase
MAAALTAAAPYLAMASAGISAISAITGGNQQAAAMEQQAAADRANADQSRVNAAVQLNQAEAEAARTDSQTRRRVAAGFNQAAASGLDPGFGSPLDLLGDIAAEGALDTQIQRWKGRAGGAAQLAQAGAFERSALFADQGADQARTSGYIRAGTTLLGGAAQYGMMRMPTLRPAGTGGAL